MPSEGDSRDIEKTSHPSDPRSHETTPVDHAVGQSRGNETRLGELEEAIANVTRLLGKTDDAETAGELVGERRAMRAELDALRREGVGNVVPITTGRRR